mmetsp:Transcript_11081/g.27261  ORF Transcript_11081/g.27261 Transcript_11081/m.27261 type:complete len:429 (+) Transcript_11081:68-1354(+)
MVVFKALLASALVVLQLRCSGWPVIADAFSAPAQTAIGVETTARKRMGKKSFLLKQSRDKLPPISTPAELHGLASSLSRRKRGSQSFYKGWIHWRAAALDAIRYDLSRNLPQEADTKNFENLFFRLGVASDVGRMPSFEDAGARSGYAVEFFCRARNLADLYVDGWNPYYEFPRFWLDSLMETPMLGGGSCDDAAAEFGDEPYSMVSLGGGPGFDYVGAALAASFSTYTSSSANETSSHGHNEKRMKATILDYEEGWGDLVHAMGNSTQRILQSPQLECSWGGKCDITKSILDPSNEACLRLVDTTDLWTCQYCVAENAESLRESKYVFFHDLFERAMVGSVFVLTEVHPRLWPEFYRLIEEHCPYMSAGFNRNGRQMMLRKERQRTPPQSISEKDRRLLKKFEDLGRYHERKIRSGWERQVPKRRGA